MKKGFIIVGECICWIVVLMIIRIILGNIFPTVDNNQVISFILYFLSAMGAIVICRLNANKEGPDNSGNKKRKTSQNKKEKGVSKTEEMSEEELLLFLNSSLM